MGSKDKIKDGGGDSGNIMKKKFVKWEKFLPKMVVRILLVEADDSTRQIITALLRKCSYKVAAVSDGLKAWEVLKGRSHSIDLILTEVELPSISGFALLTLIMEHEVCKNIPVIMMSAHDSVSTVYKCMLKGAADFLVKPVRMNELKNLWQHVWRRQFSNAVVNEKEEATEENNAASNHSSGYMACVERGSDSQSSCTKPDTEQLINCTDSEYSNHLGTEPKEAEDRTANDDTIGQDYNSTEAIDFIGSFDSYPKATCRSLTNYGTNKVDHPSPTLDLSLRRSLPCILVDKFSDDSHRLKQSDASAFSRYISKPRPPPTAESVNISISNQKKEYETTSDKVLSKSPMGYISDTHSAPIGSSQHNMISPHGQAESQSQSQSQFTSPKERVFPVQVPVRGSRFENPCCTYVSRPPFCVQPGLYQMQSPSSPEPNFQTNLYYISNPELRNESPELRNTTEALEDHTASTSFCGNNTHRSIQREAALNKFRMKRKDRCFDKKVRYESRKKLAEQRPRMKGQFVRQKQTNNHSPKETDAEMTTTQEL